MEAMPRMTSKCLPSQPELSTFPAEKTRHLGTIECAAHRPRRMSQIGGRRAGCTTGIPLGTRSTTLGAPTEAIFERSPFLKRVSWMNLAHARVCVKSLFPRSECPQPNVVLLVIGSLAPRVRRRTAHCQHTGFTRRCWRQPSCREHEWVRRFEYALFAHRSPG